MTRKRPIKTEEQEEFEVDDPSEVDDGANDSQNENPQKKVRASGRSRTPKKQFKGEDSSGEEEENEEDEGGEEEEESEQEEKKKKPRRNVATRGRGGGRASRGGGRASAKRTKREDDDEESEEEEEEDDESDGDAADTPPEFRSGCFVVLKSDFDNQEDYPLWRIDGKSLLQKFDKVTEEGEILFKSTTIYAGWSKSLMDTYYPITCDFKKVEGNDTTVKFDPAQIVKGKATVPPPKIKEEDVDGTEA